MNKKIKKVLEKIFMGVGILTVIAILSFSLTAFVDYRITLKTTTPIENLETTLETKIGTVDGKVDGLVKKFDIMASNINSIFFVICSDSLSKAQIKKLKENKLIKEYKSELEN